MRHAILVVAALAVGCGSDQRHNVSDAASSGAKSPWYEGGTLHKANLGEWRIARYENKLATSADFAAHVLRSAARQPKSMDEVYPHAIAIERCITTTDDEKKMDNLSVAEVAAGCAILLKTSG